MVEIEAEACGTNQDDDEIELMPEVAEHFHVLTELYAYPGEEVAPDQ